MTGYNISLFISSPNFLTGDSLPVQQWKSSTLIVSTLSAEKRMANIISFIAARSITKGLHHAFDCFDLQLSHCTNGIGVIIL